MVGEVAEVEEIFSMQDMTGVAVCKSIMRNSLSLNIIKVGQHSTQAAEHLGFVTQSTALDYLSGCVSI